MRNLLVGFAFFALVSIAVMLYAATESEWLAALPLFLALTLVASVPAPREPRRRTGL